jgi:RHS repeat-associated protein
MRVSKTVTPSYFPAAGTSYAYDGQMGLEEVDSSTAGTTVTDYGLGARGIDYISSAKINGSTTVGFPVYDAHGNMTACLFRSGTTSFSVGNQRHYDAWGLIRSGAGSGDPKGRYCAALGHKQDDESGLVYMRARYYEPTSGRFLREDPDLHGPNLFLYCHDNPIGRVDNTGKDDGDDSQATFFANAEWIGAVGGLTMMLVSAATSKLALCIAIGGAAFMAAWFNFLPGSLNFSDKMIGGLLCTTIGARYVLTTAAALPNVGFGVTDAVAACSAYAGLLGAFMALDATSEGN